MKILSLSIMLVTSLNFPLEKNNEFTFNDVVYGTRYAYYESYGPDQTGNSENYDVHLMSVPACTSGTYPVRPF